MCWFRIPAKVLAVRIPSAELTRKIPVAAGKRSTRSPPRGVGDRADDDAHRAAGALAPEAALDEGVAAEEDR
jgi:hypothetical protein